MTTFACLGLSWLGQCAYNPAAPTPYFTLGDAVAAIAVTILLQQFMKPVFRLRLAARYLSLQTLYLLVFAGTGVVLVASIVPQIPGLHAVPLLGYALFWEILGTLLFAFVYGAIAITVVRPVKVKPQRIQALVSVLASLMSETNDEDLIPMIADVRANLPMMVDLAKWLESHRGQDPSAAYRFTHRVKIERAEHANAMLRIIADPTFCRVIVRRAPWRVTAMIDDLSRKKLHTHAAERFVQQLAHQAILDDDGFLSRERGYHGFGAAPNLSRSLFSDDFITDEYDPLRTHFLGDEITIGVLERFNAAAERVIEAAVRSKRFNYARSMYSVESFYESAALQAWSLRHNGGLTWQFASPLTDAITMVIKKADRIMSTADERVYEQLFMRSKDEDHHDTLEPLVSIVTDTLSKISNGFTSGPGDAFWRLGMEVMFKIFGSTGEQPDGLNPFQQRVAIKIIDQLEHNMDGYYPALSRMMLAIVGPYDRTNRQANETAFNLLSRAMYTTLKRLPDLAAGRPEKLRDYLPDNVSYDAASKTLTHTFPDGRFTTTDIGSLVVEPVDFYDKNVMRKLTAGEIRDAKVDDL